MDKMALDSVRTKDRDGMLRVARTHISKATINPYYGSEIPKWEQLGLISDKIYNLLRPAAELIKAAESFIGKPILSRHIPINSVDLPQELIIGSIGSNVEFNEPYLDADLSFWENDAIVGIDTDSIKELSCAYYYDVIMEAGEGYDGYMTNINANHLALVEVGRAGSDVVVADSKPLLMRNDAMKMSKLGKALMAAIGLLSPKIALDSALPTLVGTATKKTFKKEEVSKALLALDSSVDSKILSEILDTMIALDADTIGEAIGDEDEDEEEKIKKKKLAEDEDEEDPKMTKAEVKAAMDSMRAEMREAEQARRDVREVVGDVVMAVDSAAKVYEFALDHLKIDHDGIKEPKALKALFKLGAQVSDSKTAPAIAQDSAGLNQRFPNATRFKGA